ncbi:MAG: hypothetical protein BWZ10_01620 [candidate division BRC1 bacterium ADurb.BinA364]|nr:MAG: hypothetical protein BWZ10_01620 [candidate division BRC1 bacterium ADurb.BinA364]
MPVLARMRSLSHWPQAHCKPPRLGGRRTHARHFDSIARELSHVRFFCPHQRARRPIAAQCRLFAGRSAAPCLRRLRRRLAGSHAEHRPIGRRRRSLRSGCVQHACLRRLPRVAVHRQIRFEHGNGDQRIAHPSRTALPWPCRVRSRIRNRLHWQMASLGKNSAESGGPAFRSARPLPAGLGRILGRLRFSPRILQGVLLSRIARKTRHARIRAGPPDRSGHRISRIAGGWPGSVLSDGFLRHAARPLDAEQHSGGLDGTVSERRFSAPAKLERDARSVHGSLRQPCASA